MIKKILTKKSQHQKGSKKTTDETNRSSGKAVDAKVIGKSINNETATGIDYSVKIADVAVYHPLFGRKKIDI